MAKFNSWLWSEFDGGDIREYVYFYPVETRCSEMASPCISSANADLSIIYFLVIAQKTYKHSNFDKFADQQKSAGLLFWMRLISCCLICHRALSLKYIET